LTDFALAQATATYSETISAVTQLPEMSSNFFVKKQRRDREVLIVLGMLINELP
tara:strand:- start:807 stop:968 length:162 start_codon:yes stop_codon:yes gene_type:complete